MKTNRRKFIYTTTLSFLSIKYAGGLFGMFNQVEIRQNNQVTNSQTILQMLTEASAKRKSGLLNEAMSIYNNIISINSNEIRAYDGIRKILLQSKYNELEVLNLYLNGFTLNPSNIFFKQRIANEYMRLALGNKKFNDQLNLQEDLLEKAKIYLEQVNLEIPTNEQIQKILEKVDFKLNANANTIDARLNEELKAYRKEKHLNYKNRFNGITITEIKLKLDELIEKPSDSFRDVHVRELYRIYIKKLKDYGQIELASQYTKELYLFDNKDSRSLKIARNICKKDEKYEVLEVIERNNDARKKSFWSKIALFDVLYKRYKKEGVGSLNEMTNILAFANTKKFSFYHIFEYKVRQVKLALIKNNTVEAKSLLNNFGDSLIGTSSAHFINKYNLLCIEYFLKIQDLEKAKTVYEIALKQNEVDVSDTFLKKIILVNSEKDNKKEIHNERLNKQRAKLYN